VTKALETTGLTKSYGGTHALAGLDLEVGAGQVFGYLGPNGAGKTTTIRLLLGLQAPDRGRALVLGLDPQRDGVEVHRRTGYLPGELALFSRMTGRQHIECFARARGERNLAHAWELAARLGLVADRPVKQLSKGNRQKVGLVLAFMHRPDLVVLDEPTSGLDPLVQAEVAVALLGLDFGLLSMAVGAFTGKRGTAIGLGAGLAAASYLVSSLAPVASWLRPARYVSVFYWAVGNGQAAGGMSLADYAVLGALGLCALLAAVAGFRHLDLH
jgi:ABC-type branched-subunit amino acid transport system ATPase component